MRLCQGKGVFVILIWASMYFTVLVYLIRPKHNYIAILASQDYPRVGLILIPLFGCVADIYLGRYRVIRYSQWVTWLSLMVYNVQLLVERYLWKSSVLVKVEYISMTVAFLGLAGILANIIQLGIDQLTEASSSDIISFISWYIWTNSLANVVVPFTETCFCDNIYNKPLAFFLISLLSTIGVVSDFLFNQWIVKEPVMQNPFKIIFQVLNYARKNKHPRMRSAFTYWEDKPFSRVDLGKAKYGGPFTTEQVEDVKTFFRTFSYIILSGPVSAILYISYYSYLLKLLAYRDDHFVARCSKGSVEKYFSNCYERAIVQYFEYVVVFFTIPLMELVINPLSAKFMCRIKMGSMHKIVLGMVLLLLYESLELVIAIVSSQVTENKNATCFLNVNETTLSQRQVIKIDYRWLMLPISIYGGAVCALFSGGIEFLCAQSPYSMKGTLLGVAFFPTCFVILLSEILMKLLQRWSSQATLECDIWFNLVLFLLSLMLIVALAIFLRRFSFRKRDDVLSNDQMFAVDYFEKYLTK